jgi:putative ABC transport system substrate-binding protein
MRSIGLLGIRKYVGSPLALNPYVAAIRDGLQEAGWVEGRNLVIEERWYEDHPERIPDLAAELMALKPDVLVAANVDSVRAFMSATDSIPIVFIDVADPVGLGLIASYARPGGNVTGNSRAPSDSSLGPKLLDLLRQLVPGLASVAVAFATFVPGDVGVSEWQAIRTAAQSIGIDAEAVAIASLDDAQHALDTALAGNPQAIIFSVNSGFAIRATGQFLADAITSFALQHGLPTAALRTSAGGLMYYGADISGLFRRAGSFYVDRILRGAKPADIPVEGPTEFELVVNLTVARALAIAIPPEFASLVTRWIDCDNPQAYECPQ